MNEVSAGNTSLEDWAYARIKTLLGEVQIIALVLQKYKAGTSGDQDEFLTRLLSDKLSLEDLPTILSGPVGQRIGAGNENGNGKGYQPPPRPAPAITERERIAELVLGQRNRTQTNKYHPLIEKWLDTPNLGMDNDEIYAMAKKVIRKCGDKNAVMTYIWTLKKQGRLIDFGGKKYLKGAILPIES